MAGRTLTKTLGSTDKAQRLVLSLFFREALGIERIFHFETLDDVGFALLSGGRRVLSRSRLARGDGGLRAAVLGDCEARGGFTAPAASCAMSSDVGRAFSWRTAPLTLLT